MFSFFQTIFHKVTTVIAAAAIAIGLISAPVPQAPVIVNPSNTPIVNQQKLESGKEIFKASEAKNPFLEAITTKEETTKTIQQAQPTEKVGTNIKAVDNSAELEKAKQEAETQRIAREQAERKTAELEAQQKAIQSALDKAAALRIQQETEAKQRVQEEAAALQAQIIQGQAILAQMKAECDDPINQWKQQILQLKSDYYIKVKDIQNKPMTMDSINGAINKLTNDTNMQIAEINNNIQQKALECSIKFGGN